MDWLVVSDGQVRSLIKASARDGRKAAPNRVGTAQEKWSAAQKEARPARDQRERTIWKKSRTK
ncbi:hypothetical protein Q75_03915 [Bacillus coahuilensis p1.1.43]|uniref:Uncharacterized protein n=1 Tax=Bacillus coahuilensis p1.1.43 TaxID=1150625 RepID=A0A147KAW1_9BACI|nr:hypothetical protein Q75_03915 [Bacillus coahuilensis p1.1.43]